MFEKLAKEMADTASTLFKSYHNLTEVEDVDVATAPKEVVWQRDKVKLFHYENDKPQVKIPLLVVYALVNRFDMMDLQPDRSLIRNLLGLGVDMYIIDWGYPTRPDRYLTLDDYVNGYIDDCIEHIRDTTGAQKVNILGVCQGGTMSTIYSALHPEKVNSLITMVTPIDFNTSDGLLFKWSRDMDVDAIVDSHGGLVPGDFLNMGFDLLKPFGKLRKYSGLTAMLEDKDKMLNFLRMEKWVGDRPDQAGEAYRQFIKDLYQQNKLIKGELVVGEPVDLKNVTMPLLNIYASDDHMVPPSATKPLNDFVGSKDKQLYEFPGGHIGVFVGSRSQKELGPTIAKWLKERSK